MTTLRVMTALSAVLLMTLASPSPFWFTMVWTIVISFNRNRKFGGKIVERPFTFVLAGAPVTVHNDVLYRNVIFSEDLQTFRYKTLDSNMVMFMVTSYDVNGMAKEWTTAIVIYDYRMYRDLLRKKCYRLYFILIFDCVIIIIMMPLSWLMIWSLSLRHWAYCHLAVKMWEMMVVPRVGQATSLMNSSTNALGSQFSKQEHFWMHLYI